MCSSEAKPSEAFRVRLRSQLWDVNRRCESCKHRVKVQVRVLTWLSLWDQEPSRSVSVGLQGDNVHLLRRNRRSGARASVWMIHTAKFHPNKEVFKGFTAASSLISALLRWKRKDFRL